MKVLNPSLRPPGGYSFTDQSGTPFESDSVENLVKAVRGFRRRRGIPVGDPFSEIQAVLCKRSPRLCRERPDPRTLSDRVLETTLDLVESPVEQVPVAEMEKRAAICARCPAKAAWQHLCVTCTGKVGKLSKVIARGRTLPKELSGFACTIAGDDLPLAVALKQAALPGVPVNCWRKL